MIKNIEKKYKKFLKKKEKEFEAIGIKEKPEKYFKKRFKKSFYAFFFALLVLTIAVESISLAFIVSIIFLFLILTTIFFAPKNRFLKEKRVSEKQLPFFLIELSLKLKAGENFFTAIKSTAEKKKDLFSRQMLKTIKNIKQKGETFNSGLQRISKLFESQKINRAMSYIFSSYYTGTEKDSDNLLMLAEELIKRAEQKQKEKSGYLSMLVITFASVSSLVPAIFLAYLSVGTLILKTGLNYWDVIIISCVLFPAIDLAFLIALKKKQEE